MNETTTMPVLAPVEPQLLAFDAALRWNYADIETYLKAVTERYRNLIVTDDNVEDMGKVKREVVSLRTHLQKFERVTKTKLKKPVDDFTMQCRNLYQIIAAVEEPLNAQLQIYEDRRIADVKAQIQREIAAKAQALGVRDAYIEQVAWDSKWTNKTAKWSETVVEIDHELVRLKAVQQADDDREQLRRDRQEMARMYVDQANASYGLRSPLQAEEILTDSLLSQGLADMKAAIFKAAEDRKAIEDTAVQQAAPPVPPLPPLPPLPKSDPPAEHTEDYKDMIITIHHVHMGDYDRVCAALDQLSYPYDVALR
ncbi:DUF1351 domain-containing protein [Megasphaera stantonii]|uniref:DUF1351 domain-containing protein n=1 Tax=Megasphaera stantonii TaxID=2144175 RepID=UPI0019577DA3|nr:DUF1351 domain-containing protein [Megasphaera stantonii]MBM6732884.1 DUF1351 domain-containing protein [Megasphaera stantonii]